MEVVNIQSKKKLLIIGGTGFIGLNITKLAILHGFQVSIISKNDISVNDVDNRVELLSVDICNKEELHKIIHNKIFHYVINLAGYVDHSNYSDGGHKVIETHLNGTKNIIDCINKYHLKGFVYIGSSDEYGSNPAPQNEIQRESPISPYSFAKTASTHLLQMLHRTEDFPVTILRLFLAYGSGQSGERFIPQVIQGCIDNNKFAASSGEQLRDFCHIDDISNAVFLALTNKKAHGEVINIASGVPVSIKDVISLIKSLIGSGRPQFGLLPYRTGENMELYADISKAEKILGWSPKVDLADGLKRLIDQYDEQ